MVASGRECGSDRDYGWGCDDDCITVAVTMTVSVAGAVTMAVPLTLAVTVAGV